MELQAFINIVTAVVIVGVIFSSGLGGSMGRRAADVGTFTVPIQIGNLAGAQFVDITALVDTGTTYASLPGSILTRLGVEQEGYRRFELADSRVVEYPIGYSRVRVDRNETVAQVVFAPEDTSPLLGATTLENLGLGVDPVHQRLIPVPALL